jgi:hypothetical protein
MLPFAEYYPLPLNSEYIEFTRVSHSSDGGATWSAPVTVPNPLMADDKDMVLADQLIPGTVYTASRNTNAGAPIGARGEGQVLFGRSVDGGQTFSLTVLEDSGSTALSYGEPLLAELDDGTLVYTYGLPSGAEVARLSSDGGLSWSARISVAPAPTSGDIQACGSPVALRADSGQDAVLNGKEVVRVFVNRSAEGTYSLMLSRSNRAATSWQTSTLFTSQLPIGLPSIATDSGGRIAVVYDEIDAANISCAPVTVPARTVVAVSSDEGRSWGSVTVGARWWNFAAGGVDPGFGEYWVADYQAIVANRHGFTTATPQGPTLSGTAPQGGITGFVSIIAGEVRVGDQQ